MLLFVGRRILYAFPIALGVSIVCFTLVHLAPGDPISALVPDDSTPQVIAQIKAAYGLDKPAPIQYLFWLRHVMVGDFGRSLATGRPVLGEVAPATLNTLELAAGAIAIACSAGVLLGALAAYRVGRLSDRAISSLGIGGMSIPQYWLAMVLIAIFAVEFHVLPATGMGDPHDSLLARASHLILPVIALAAAPTGIIARSVRSTVFETLQQEFVEALRAKGLSERRIFLHVAKNAAPTVLAVMGLQFSHLMGGSILVETIFAWPGAGYLLNSAIFMRDLPVIQGTVLVLAMFFVAVNLGVDVLQMFVDPRLKQARRGKAQ